MRPRLLLHIALICALAPRAEGGPTRSAGAGGTAAAQPDEVIEVHEPEPDGAADRARALAEPAFVSRVDVAARAGEQIAVAELVSEAVGVALRSLGGLGSFAVLSVRGTAPGHTQVTIDGVPVSRLGSATADLGTLELAGVSTIELYRGGAPGRLGGAAGSALHLESQVGPTPDGHRLRLSSGLGSFGARSLAARLLGGDDALGWVTAASYAGARGDFRYFDDRGTNLNLDDDRTVRRANAGYDAIEAVARLRARARLVAEGGLRTSWRAQGVPGPGNAQTSRAELGSLRQTADGAVRDATLRGGRLALGASAFGVVERQRYRDPLGEIGVGQQDRRYQTLAAGVTGTADALHRGGRASAAVELSGESYREEELAATSRLGARGRRLGGALELADALEGARFTVRPSLRLEEVATRAPPNFDAGTGPAPVTTRHDRIVAPRLGARLALGSDAALKASAARYVRLPTALELFGDRGVVIGNPALVAERGWTGELGVVVAPTGRFGALDRAELEVVGFATRSSDTIALVPTAALVVVPQNLGDARALGGELSAAGRLFGALAVLAHYTLVHTRQSDTLPSYEGKELPHRPRHRLYGRAELGGRRRGRALGVWSDLDLTVGNHLDPANLDRAPRRLLVGLGGKVELVPGLLLGAEIENLLDARIETVELDPAPRPDLARVPRAVADFYGYPLPGRAYYLTVQWET